MKTTGRLGSAACMASIALAVFASTDADAQQQLDRTRLLIRVSANYRSCRSIRVEGTWTRKIGDKETKASIALAAMRPNLYRLEIKGPDIGTDVVSDGRTLTALRTHRNVYTRSAAPEQLIGGDILKGIDLPAPGVQLITLMLQGMWRDARHPLAQRLGRAEVTGPVAFGDRQAYVLAFDYNADYSARVYVTTDDNLLRRATLYHGGKPEITETFTKVEFDTNLSPAGFARELPEAALQVTSLPPVVLPAAPKPITLKTYDDRTISFNELRGKVVLVTFFFTTCTYCNEEMPHLEELYRRFKGSGLEIVAVNGTGETKEAIKQWADGHGLTFPVALNKTTTDLVSMFKVQVYPTNVIFNKEGKVVYKKEGLDLEGMLKALAEAGAGKS